MFKVTNWQWNDLRESEIMVTAVKKKWSEYKFKTAALSFKPATFWIVAFHSSPYTNFCQPVVRGSQNGDLHDDCATYVFVLLSPNH